MPWLVEAAFADAVVVASVVDVLSLPPAAALPIDDLKIRIKTERLERCFFLREKKAKTKGKSTELFCSNATVS